MSTSFFLAHPKFPSSYFFPGFFFFLSFRSLLIVKSLMASWSKTFSKCTNSVYSTAYIQNGIPKCTLCMLLPAQTTYFHWNMRPWIHMGVSRILVQGRGHELWLSNTSIAIYWDAWNSIIEIITSGGLFYVFTLCWSSWLFLMWSYSALNSSLFFLSLVSISSIRLKK